MSDLKFLDDLSLSLETIPGVGKKTAQRYAYNIIENLSDEEVERIAETLVSTKKAIKHCRICGMLTTLDTCEICSNQNRDKKKIMVLKDTRDIVAIEKVGEFNGYYHSLNGLISLMDGIGPDDINVASLEERVKEGVEEVILATPFTPAGETTAMYLEKILKRDDLIISKLGYGISAGSDIEFIDELTLKRAVENRQKR